MIIGFDVSTRCVGYSVLNDDGSLCDIGYIWLAKVKGEYNKLDAFKNTLENSIKISGDVFVFVEAPLGRSNNQNVVNILQRFNGQVCLLVHQYYGVEPILIPETEVRKINGIKIPKGVKKEAKKIFVLNILQKLDIVDPSRWKLKRTGKYKDFCYDMSDSYWVARAGYEQLKTSQGTIQEVKT